MNNSTNRATLVQACVDAVNTFMLDGIDIDWVRLHAYNMIHMKLILSLRNTPTTLVLETPTLPQMLRIFSSSSNLCALRWEPANSSPPPLLINPGSGLMDVHLPMSLNTLQCLTLSILCGFFFCRTFASWNSYFIFRNYDVYGASANPGPNAPLGDLCNKSRYPEANAYAAFAAWTAAGFPAGKLLLGIPLYGYVSKSSKTVLVDSVTAQVAKEDCGVLKGAHARPVPPPAASSSVAPGDLSAYWGQQIAFKDILRLGALKPKGDGTYVPANGYTMGWHDCSDTPVRIIRKRHSHAWLFW